MLGNISIWKMQMYLTAARAAAFEIINPETGNTFLEFDKLVRNVYTFMVSTRIEMSREAYRLFPHTANQQRLETIINLGYVGHTSLNNVAILKELNSEKELARSINQLVMVDMKTRKPAPLLKWWKDKYAGSAVYTKPTTTPPLDIPGKSFEYEMKVPWNEIDSYKHTNYISYMRFCFDAAMEATQSGFFTKFSPGDDIFKYHPKYLLAGYTGESKAGDILSVRTWENSDNPYVVHFNIKKEGQTIFRNTIEFHRSEA